MLACSEMVPCDQRLAAYLIFIYLEGGGCTEARKDIVAQVCDQLIPALVVQQLEQLCDVQEQGGRGRIPCIQVPLHIAHCPLLRRPALVTHESEISLLSTTVHPAPRTRT